jgi:hypothetical protein
MKTKAQGLPDVLRRVHAIGGHEAVLKFAHAFGGRRFFVPVQPVSPGHPLAIAGKDVAAMLVEEFGGNHVEFPKGGAHIRLMIAREVIARKGSNNEIAQAAGVTWRWAKKLRRLARNPKGTPSPRTVGRPRARDARQIDIDDLLRPK